MKYALLAILLIKGGSPVTWINPWDQTGSLASLYIDDSYMIPRVSVTVSRFYYGPDVPDWAADFPYFRWSSESLEYP